MTSDRIMLKLLIRSVSSISKFIVEMYILCLIYNSLPAILLLAVQRRLFCFGFFGDFRCGASLFIVIRIKYKYSNRKKKDVEC